MNFKSSIVQIKKRFLELLKYQIFRYAIIIHLFYFIGSYILFFLGLEGDFLVYYEAGDIFLNDINTLYTHMYKFPFRYFPLSALFFSPFSLLSLELSFIIFNAVNLILNILICVILYKIIIFIRRDENEKDEKRIITYLSLYLIGFPQVSNYVLGQINLYLSLLILISLFIFLKYDGIKWQIIGSFILGISFVIKPISIFLIPFLLIINYDMNTRKIKFDFRKSAIRIITVLIPLALNVIIFFIYPNLLEDFIYTNFTSEYAATINPSFSITKLITNFCSLYNIPFNQLFIFIGVLCIIGGIGLFLFLYAKDEQHSIIYGYILGIIIMFLVYFDTWDHHILILTPILIIVIFDLPRKSDITKKFLKPGFYVLNFLNLVGFGIVGILTISFFPYNFVSTVFMLLILYGIGKYSLLKNSVNRDD